MCLCTGRPLTTCAERPVLQSVSLCSSYKLEGLDEFYYNSSSIQASSESDSDPHNAWVPSPQDGVTFEDLDEFFHSDVSSVGPPVEVLEHLNPVQHHTDQQHHAHFSLPFTSDTNPAEPMHIGTTAVTASDSLTLPHGPDVATPSVTATEESPLLQNTKEMDGSRHLLVSNLTVSNAQSNTSSELGGSLIHNMLLGTGGRCGPHSLQELRDREDWPVSKVSTEHEVLEPWTQLHDCTAMPCVGLHPYVASNFPLLG